MGGTAGVHPFYRMLVAPGLGHSHFTNGTTNPDANPPMQGHLQLHNLIVDWVENGIAPDKVVFSSETNVPVKKSLPMCSYPAQPTYVSGSIFEASSYKCQ